MPKDLKSPSQQPAEPNRGKQLETPALVYTDLASGEVCLDGYQYLPNHDVPDPAVRTPRKPLANTSVKPSGIGVQSQA